MLPSYFVILGALISLIGGLTYAYHTVKGDTKPNRVTWLIWATAPMIIFSAELSEGVGLRSLMTFSVGFSPAMIFVASFINKQAYWKITKLDIFCGAVAVCALILWRVTGEGNLAIMFALLADTFAGIPTFIKSFKQPETEHPSVFRNGALNSGITLLTIDRWEFADYAFPIYIFLSCFGTYLLLKSNVGPRMMARFGKVSESEAINSSANSSSSLS